MKPLGKVQVVQIRGTDQELMEMDEAISKSSIHGLNFMASWISRKLQKETLSPKPDYWTHAVCRGWLLVSCWDKANGGLDPEV